MKITKALSALFIVIAMSFVVLRSFHRRDGSQENAKATSSINNNAVRPVSAMHEEAQTTAIQDGVDKTAAIGMTKKYSFLTFEVSAALESLEKEFIANLPRMLKDPDIQSGNRLRDTVANTFLQNLSAILAPDEVIEYLSEGLGTERRSSALDWTVPGKLGDDLHSYMNIVYTDALLSPVGLTETRPTAVPQEIDIKTRAFLEGKLVPATKAWLGDIKVTQLLSDYGGSIPEEYQRILSLQLSLRARVATLIAADVDTMLNNAQAMSDRQSNANPLLPRSEKRLAELLPLDAALAEYRDSAPVLVQGIGNDK